jgi:glutaconate CoA-transferase subunit B
MKLESVHPGVSVKQVKENTGFEIMMSNEVPETEPPTSEQIELIRNRIDRKGVLIPR